VSLTIRKALHWTVVVLCLAQIPTSWAIHRTHLTGPFGPPPDQFDLLLHQVHAWSGWLIFGMAAAGVAWRLARRSEPCAKARFRLVAAAAHWSLYGLRIALAVTGTLTMYVSGLFSAVHNVLTKLLLAVTIAHALGAFAHHFIWRDCVLASILPKLRDR